MSLTANYTFVGRGNWSIDGVGGNSTSGGTVSAIIPEGSSIERAFLYSSTFLPGATITSVDLAFGGSTVTVDDFAALGATAAGASFPDYLQAFRADVTSFVAGAVGDGDDSAFSFNLSNIVSNFNSVDGLALVVVYANPDESIRTISLLDGFSATTGDDFDLSFSEPLDTTQPGFEALMSLGIGFSTGNSQSSRITVDGRQLTTAAGGFDDGAAANGGLFTIGGVGDSSANPDPDISSADDDELYDLAQGNVDDSAPFLADGAEGISVTTLNPSNDDNIFFAGFNITAVVAVDTGENDAPVAVGDEVSVAEDATATFNVLGNDFDPDDGDEFNVTSFDTTGLLGTLTDNGDGGFTYDPNGAFDLDEGEEATTSFTYTISDGEESATATVTITVTGDDGEGPPPVGDCPTIDRPGTEDGSSSASQVLTGADYHNSFYFDNGGDVGDDRITNFAADDVIVTDLALRDNNGDGAIGFGGNGLLDLSGANGGTIAVDGVMAIRFLGEACEDNWVYGAAYVRPDGAQEGFVLTDDVMGGEETDSEADIFFFDTALDLDLGDDVVDAFGARDVLVTTTRIFDRNDDDLIGFGSDGLLDLPGGVGGPGDPGLPGAGGTVSMTNNFGGTISSLEYDGSVEREGVTYYVYSTVGSSVGVEALA